jgi:hypothetical protein
MSDQPPSSVEQVVQKWRKRADDSWDPKFTNLVHEILNELYETIQIAEESAVQPPASVAAPYAVVESVDEALAAVGGAMNAKEFVDRCRDIRDGSPNAFYALIDTYCKQVEDADTLAQVRQRVGDFNEGYHAGYEHGLAGDAEDADGAWDRSRACSSLVAPISSITKEPPAKVPWCEACRSYRASGLVDCGRDDCPAARRNDSRSSGGRCE